jgi:hypothetical protein
MTKKNFDDGFRHSPTPRSTLDMTTGFAVVRDGDEHPVAVFQDLENAIDWVMERLGQELFTIRHFVFFTEVAHARIAS